MLVRKSKIDRLILVLSFCGILLSSAQQPAAASEIFTWGRDCYDWSYSYILGDADINPDYVTEHSFVGRVIKNNPLTMEVFQINGEERNPGEDWIRYPPEYPQTVGELERLEYLQPAVTPAAFDQTTLYQFNDIIRAGVYVQSKCDPVGTGRYLVHDISLHGSSPEDITDRSVLLRYRYGKDDRLVVYFDGRIEYFIGYYHSVLAGRDRLSRQEALTLRESLADLGETLLYAAPTAPDTAVEDYLIISRDQYVVTPVPNSGYRLEPVIDILESVARRVRRSQKVKLTYRAKTEVKIHPWDAIHFTLDELLEERRRAGLVREKHQVKEPYNPSDRDVVRNLAQPITDTLRKILAKRRDEPAFIAEGGKLYHITMWGYGYDKLDVREVTVEKNETLWRRWPVNISIDLKDVPREGIILKPDRLRSADLDFLESVREYPRYVEDGFVYDGVHVNWMSQDGRNMPRPARGRPGFTP